MSKFSFAVIGCGRMGKRRAYAITQNKNSEVTCVVDNDAAQARLLSEIFNCDYYTNYQKAIKREDLNAVVVCAPNKFHAETSIASMNLGKHVFCEKPLARTPEEAMLMVRTALENDVFLKTGSNVRYFSSVLKAKELIDGGTIGEILFLRGWIGHEGWNLKPGSWFMDSEMIGGGTLLDNGCHLIDLIRWFMGEISECMGYSSALYHPLHEREDNAMGILIGVNRKMAFIQSSWTEWNPYLYLEIYGSNGAIYIDEREGSSKLSLKLKGSKSLQIFDYSREPKTSFKLEVDDFINSLLLNKHPEPSGYDGMRAIQIIHGIYTSAKFKRVTNVFTDEEMLLQKKLREKFESKDIREVC